MTTLHDALAAEQTAAAAHADRCREVWVALQSEAPELARTIHALFPDDTMAAHWVCARHGERRSPAALVAAGCTDEVETRLLRILHGIGA